MQLHIGLDDVDSLSGGCTTHAATLLAYSLIKKFGAKLLEPLNLVRLNPSIPWKTRGNGAVCIRVSIPNEELETILLFIESFICNYVNKFKGSIQDPGVAVLIGEVPEDLGILYRIAISDLVTNTLVKYMIRRYNIKVLIDGKGLIGALAAISWIASRNDYTFELLTYRSIQNYGISERCIDVDSVLMYDSLCKHTFNNVYRGKLLIAPHGPDPVLYGVRGDDPEELLKALEYIKVCEPLAAYALFITNQGTDDHVRPRLYSSMSRNYRCGWTIATLIDRPTTIKGGHVILKLLDSTGIFKAIVFRETEYHREVKTFSVGTKIMVQGCFKPFNNEPYLHIEKIFVLKAPTTNNYRPHRCPRCGSKMKYMGLGRGYRCLNCGLIMHLPPRRNFKELLDKRFLYPPPHRQKHLVKPLNRYIKSRHTFTPRPILECYEPLDFL